MYPLYACFYLSGKYGYSNIDSSHKNKNWSYSKFLANVLLLQHIGANAFFGSNLTFYTRYFFGFFSRSCKFDEIKLKQTNKKKHKKNSRFVCSKLVAGKDSRQLDRCFEIQKLSREKEKKIMCDLSKNLAPIWIFQPQKRPQAHSSSFLALKCEDQRILRMQKRFVWKSLVVDKHHHFLNKGNW